MSKATEWKKLAVIIAIFIGCYFLPIGTARFDNALMESLQLVKWYAREHVLLCLVPAFFIAGAISVFVSQASVMKYLGAQANKVLAYAVASISGSILAVCSCTVLPLFAGIYKMGAGLGPASTFLYSGPAINILAIILTARVLGLEIGIARAVGAIIFSIVIGLAMHLIYRKEEIEKAGAQATMPHPEVNRKLWQNAVYFAVMVGILVFANWARSGDVRAVFLCCPGGLSKLSVEGTLLSKDQNTVKIQDVSGKTYELSAELVQQVEEVKKNNLYSLIHQSRWVIVSVLLVGFAIMLGLWFTRPELSEWVGASWGLTKQMLPLLLMGVFTAGLLLGRPGPGHEGVIPTEWVNSAVGGNSIRANLFAAIAGAFMYFATLTEVPILQGLMGAGMGKGPALALLLAGPALSLPNMLVIRSVMGTQKTVVFVSLVIVIATLSGIIFGTFF
ncbi:MAG: permease [Sedimentisphaerales bacterium]|nr:permease [Sedimentisphaerales bacterium]